MSSMQKAMPGQISSAKFGVNTVETEMADNDYALGLVIQKMANNPFKDSTLIFVVEDDAQNGADIDLTYTHANNELTGNGAAPQSILATDRTAVYAHPEITSPDMDMVNMTLIHNFSDRTTGWGERKWYRHL